MTVPTPSAKPFDLLALLAAFARARGIALDDPSLIDAFTADATRQITWALADSVLLHGMRAERLFEATVLSLGKFNLFKAEDNGRVHAAEIMRAPDFRVVLDDGEERLIEVKNVYCKDPLEQEIRLSASYYRSVRRYADAVGVPLWLAIYWARWKIWTVVSPEPFRRPSGALRIRMEDAFIVNEFGRLGDVSISTRFPLRIVRAVVPEPYRDQNLDAVSYLGPMRMFSTEVELTHPRDRKLAEVLCLYGEWPTSGPEPIRKGDELVGVQYVFAPVEPGEQPIEDSMGTASTIFSRFYSDETIEGDRVVQLLGEARPDWFAPLSDWPFGHSELPLWLKRFRPNHALLTKLLSERA